MPGILDWVHKETENGKIKEDSARKKYVLFITCLKLLGGTQKMGVMIWGTKYGALDKSVLTCRERRLCI